MEEVEAIVVKDMSRLGRDYLKVGQIMEILRIKGVLIFQLTVDGFGPYQISQLLKQ
jgi:DNA invertase Pin-like site-specific DNA recombinase